MRLVVIGSLIVAAATAMAQTDGEALADPVDAVAGSARDVETVRQCVQANLPKKSLKQSYSLESFDRGGGSRTLVGKIYADQKSGKDRLMVAVDAPLDLRGVRYLMLEKTSRDDMYMYLPGLDKVRRIRSSQMQDTSLFGSDFSYEDIKQVLGNFARGEVTMGDNAEYGGRTAHVLTLIPPADKESAYAKVVSWVDTESCVVLSTEFHHATHGLVKRLDSNVDSLKSKDGRHWLAEVTMRDLVAETHSVLLISDVVFDSKIPTRLFNPRTFQKGN